MANSRPRIGSAAKPSSSSGRRPQSCARRPTHGESTATTSCGTTMQAAIRTVAHWLDRMVRTLPISGSIAALARWNSSMQPAKISSGRLRSSAASLVRGLSGATARHCAVGPLGIDLARRDERSASSAGHEQQRGDEEDRAGGKQIAARAHRGGRQAVADRGEARIAAEPLADRRMADEAEADRRDGRAEHAARQRVQDRRRQHHREDRQRRIGRAR